ncbi:MAG TPA: ABC transporter substrate-binding protein [Methylomirabilota bacterium]|jgi:putative ABC transport system substrate-binding protein
MIGARRIFIALVAIGVLFGPFATEAQQVTKAYRIGFLGATSPAGYAPQLEAFRGGLRDLGYVEGKNLAIDFRWAEGNYARLPGLAAELVRLKPDVLVTHAGAGTRAAKQATSTIPIVFGVAGEAVAMGLVESLARPGGNATGSSFFFPELNAKRLEVLKEAVPRLSRVGVLLNPDNPANVATLRAMEETARSVNVQLHSVEVRRPAEFDGAFVTIMKGRMGALAVYDDAMFIAEAARIADLARKNRLPTIGFVEYAKAGGLLAFGVNFTDLWRRAAGFVDKILKGARPADLPVEQPTKFELIVNLRTARALGLTMSPSLLVRADQVIE